MVLIKTRKNTFLCNKLFALEENAGLAHVLDDAEKKEKDDNCLTTDLHFDKWCSKFQEIIDIAQFFFQYK